MYIHFVDSEIRRYQFEKDGHYFFIYNPGTEWYPKFDQLAKSNPLPVGFCGYFHNLELLCGLLHHVLRPSLGPDAVFHILVPSNGPLIMPDPVLFPAAIGKLHIKGELDAVNNGCPYVWMNIRNITQNLVLDSVGNMQEPDSWREVASLATFLGAWAVSGGSALISTVALSPVLGPATVVWWLASGIGALHGSAALAGSVQNSEGWDVNPRILGSSFCG